MWGKILIPMYRLWLNSLYGLYGPRCPLSSKRPINLISLSLSLAWSKSCLPIFLVKQGARASAAIVLTSFSQNIRFPRIFWFQHQKGWLKKTLTLNMRGRSYLGLTRSISWLLMPWLLTSPGHQQSWYWLCRICKSWSYLRKDFKYLCHINVE